MSKEHRVLIADRSVLTVKDIEEKATRALPATVRGAHLFEIHTGEGRAQLTSPRLLQ